MLNKWKRKGHIVFAVDGNHEHYGNLGTGRSQAETTEAFYRGLEQKQTLDIDGYRLIGTNGWYEVEDERHWHGYMNDCRYTQITGPEMNRLAQREAEWMDAQLHNLPPNKRAIVVTHTAPCEESLDPKYAGSDGNVYYYNPLMTPLLGRYADRIAIWHHGHTHASVDVVKDGVRIVTNPRGYPSENPKWQPRVLEV